MPTSLEATYSSIRREIAVLLGMDRDPNNWSSIEESDVAAIIDEGLNNFYFNAIDPRSSRLHLWSFLKPQATITTSGPYTTGTIEISSGVVTLSDGTFPAWAGTATLEVEGDYYDVDSRDSNTQLTLVDTSLDVDSGTDYLLGRNKYDMPDDYMGMDSQFTFSHGEGGIYPPVKLISEEEIRHAESHWNHTWPPIVGAIVPKTTDNTATQKYRLILYPTPDTSYVLYYTYRRIPPTLDDTYQYAWGGAPYSLAIKFSILAAAEVKMFDEMRNYSAKYNQSLIAAIDNDLRLNAPQYFGTSQDPQEPNLPPEHHGDALPSKLGDLTIRSGFEV